MKKHPLVHETGRVNAYVCDIVNDPLPMPIVSSRESSSSLSSSELQKSEDPVPLQSIELPESGMDLVLCMFVLSAISPKASLVKAILKLAASLKVGGKLLIRDYGRLEPFLGL